MRVFLEARGVHITYVEGLRMCLFISRHSQQCEIHEGCLARFKGESNRNLNEDFTISVKDAICITLSRQDNYCQSRQRITPEEIVILLFVIIDQVDILSGGRLAVIINTDDINIHASRRIMHCGNHA